MRKALLKAVNIQLSGVNIQESVFRSQEKTNHGKKLSIICGGDAGLADSVPVGCEAFWVKPTKLYKVAALF